MSSVKSLNLMCLVWPNEEPGQHIVTVTVTIDSDKTIGYLKRLIILEYGSSKLDKVAASDLVLWKCSITVDDDTQKKLSTIHFDASDALANTCLLLSTSTILECFPTVLPPNTIHILIQIHNYGVFGNIPSSEFMLN